jgi:hypothetical protein
VCFKFTLVPALYKLFHACGKKFIIVYEDVSFLIISSGYFSNKTLFRAIVLKCRAGAAILE